MIGNHGYEVILDGYVKGIVSNDLATVAYEAMKEEVHIHCRSKITYLIYIMYYFIMTYIIGHQN